MCQTPPVCKAPKFHAPLAADRPSAREVQKKLDLLTLYGKVGCRIQQTNSMKFNWFKSCGLLYAPVSLPGAIVTLLAAAFCLQVFLAMDRHSHSVSDTLYSVYPFFVCTFLLWDWVARRTSAPQL